MTIVKRFRSSRRWWGRCAPLLVVFLAHACATGSGGAPESAEPAAPQLPAPEGEHYVFVGATAADLRMGDTRTGDESVLAATGGSIVAFAPSPGGRRLAIAHPYGDTVVISLIDLAGGAVRRLAAVPASVELSMVWSPDGDRFGMGVRTDLAAQGIFVADTSGALRDVGCAAADRIEAFRGADQLIVSDRANFYAVDSDQCKTLATLPGSGKTGVRYSPTGRSVAFLRNHQTAGRPELWLAEYNGAGARVITSYNFQPADVRWSPDGRRLAFMVQSQEHRNVSHVATYDAQTGEADAGREETALGVPSDSDPCWAPDGSRYALSRSYRRRGATGQDYETRQTVVRPASGGASRVVSEDLIGEPTHRGGRCQWIDADHILVRSPAGYKVVNLPANTAYDLPDWSNVFAVFVP